MRELCVIALGIFCAGMNLLSSDAPKEPQPQYIRLMGYTQPVSAGVVYTPDKDDTAHVWLASAKKSGL